MSASKSTFLPLIKDYKFDIWMMSSSNDICEKAMKENFFQRNHTETNYRKKVATPYLIKNSWMIPHLWALILQNMSSPETNMEKQKINISIF